MLVTERTFVGWARKCGAEMAEALKTRFVLQLMVVTNKY